MRSILEIPQFLIRKGIPFAIYSLPGSDEFVLISQNSTQIYSLNILDISDFSGFVIASFNSARTGVANIIKPDFVIYHNDSTDEIFNHFKDFSDNGGCCFLDNVYMEKKEYLDVAEYVVEKLKSDDFDKIVLSRVIGKELEKKLPIEELLIKINQNFKNNFVSLFHIPGVGTWFGATPEYLIQEENNVILTESLAGTRFLKSDSDLPDWTKKEIEEQAFVTEFLRKVMSELGIHDYNESSLRNVVSGDLAHLQTEISISKKSAEGKIGRLIAALHPTPAVCGLPKADAFNIINRAEKHQRRYYTGFLGPWAINGDSRLFVNLRCAELGDDKINIYVGGGLTADSVPEKEFEETIHKSKAILSVVENL